MTPIPSRYSAVERKTTATETRLQTWRPHGTVDLKKALEVSCNVYFGKLSEKLGGDTLEKYTKKAGLMDSLDINGIHTAAGTFEFPSSGVTLAWTGIGQNKDMINPCAMMVYMGPRQ